ncbi:hypothetical protein D3C77_493650 [compost metagenome]
MQRYRHLDDAHFLTFGNLEISRILPKASMSGLKHCKALYLYSLIVMNELLNCPRFSRHSNGPLLADFCLSPPAAMRHSQPVLVTKRAGQTHLQHPCNKAMVSTRNDVATITFVARIAMRQHASYPKPFNTLALPFVKRTGRYRGAADSDLGRFSILRRDSRRLLTSWLGGSDFDNSAVVLGPISPLPGSGGGVSCRAKRLAMVGFIRPKHTASEMAVCLRSAACPWLSSHLTGAT